ncbi:hypothetical protein PtrSN002B_011564, partial [Pyrenophora tritici-repentis]
MSITPYDRNSSPQRPIECVPVDIFFKPKWDAQERSAIFVPGFPVVAKTENLQEQKEGLLAPSLYGKLERPHTSHKTTSPVSDLRKTLLPASSPGRARSFIPAVEELLSKVSEPLPQISPTSSPEHVTYTNNQNGQATETALRPRLAPRSLVWMQGIHDPSIRSITTASVVAVALSRKQIFCRVQFQQQTIPAHKILSLAAELAQPLESIIFSLDTTTEDLPYKVHGNFEAILRQANERQALIL